MTARRVKLPSFQFYPGDWLRDAGLRACTAASRGVWMDLLCFMHDSPVRGFLLKSNGQPFTGQELARALGVGPVQLRRHLAELESAGVFDRDERGVIVSRRMASDEDARRQASDNGKRGGNPELIRGKPEGLAGTAPAEQPGTNRGVNPPLNRVVGDGLSPSSSSSSTSPSTKQEEEIPEPPDGGPGEPPPACKPAPKPKADPGPETVPIPPVIDTPEFRATWSKWIASRKAKRKPITLNAAEMQLKKLAGLGPALAVECVSHSIANDYQGLIFEKFPPGKPPGGAVPPFKSKADRDQEQLEREFEACHSHLFPGGPE